MDTNTAITLSTNYLKKLKASNVDFSEAWLFGSYATQKQHENSDIDLAIVFDNAEDNTFDKEVQLMVLRNGEETIIEPHTFSKEDFSANLPIVNQILTYGLKLEV